MEPNAIVVECVAPQLDGGHFPVKRLLGETFTAEADIYRHGHDILSAALWYRLGNGKWQRQPMRDLGNDRWQGSFPLTSLGTYEYAPVAWVETFASWRRDTLRKREARQPIASDLIEGAALVRAALPRVTAAEAECLRAALAPAALASGDGLLASEVELILRRYSAPAAGEASRAAATDPPHAQTRYVLVERERAAYGAWYEMFPRSQGTDPNRSATFRECEQRLEEIASLGFDVVYLPPIHPIGTTNRKGPNNALTAAPGDPGSPYAIGSEAGGHDAIEPGLGTLADFDHFVARCRQVQLEVALDFALNCSPDHPWVRQHPEWFFHRPDGSIKYAENPPKRYEDIYPLNLDGEHREAIAAELRRVLLFWAGHGVRIFRVDNPHTKPMPMWQWLLAEVRAVYPDAIFLSEAFTRPKPMKHLAKIGFSQSYTYFTWRNTKEELSAYITELALGPSREYFRPNFFVNTPDILPQILQQGGRPAFLMRLLLAATLSPSWGMYNGYELCENRALPNSEEYADSEKYQFKVWDWDRAGHIKPWVARVNQIRREHPALQRIEGVKLLRADNPQLLLYARYTPDCSDRLVVCVNLDPYHPQEGPIEIPTEALGLGNQFAVEDLLAAPRGVWQGRNHYLRIDPFEMPGVILRVSG